MNKDDKDFLDNIINKSEASLGLYDYLDKMSKEYELTECQVIKIINAVLWDRINSALRDKE